MDGDVRVQWDARGSHLGTQPGSVYGEESRVESSLSGVRAWFFWKARAGASAVASRARYFSRKPRGTRNMAFNIPRISSGFGTRVCDESSLEARPREGRTTGRICTIDHAPPALLSVLTLTLLARPRRSRRVASTCPVLFRLSLLAPSTIDLHCTHVAFSVRVRSNRFSIYRNDLASSCVSLFQLSPASPRLFYPESYALLPPLHLALPFFRIDSPRTPLSPYLVVS